VPVFPALLLTEHDEDWILERIDDTIGDYIDADAVEKNFNGSIGDWYAEYGNRVAENQVLNELIEPYLSVLGDIEASCVMTELAEAWSIQNCPIEK
jgi:hypothetical protein